MVMIKNKRISEEKINEAIDCYDIYLRKAKGVQLSRDDLKERILSFDEDTIELVIALGHLYEDNSTEDVKNLVDLFAGITDNRDEVPEVKEESDEDSDDEESDEDSDDDESDDYEKRRRRAEEAGWDEAEMDLEEFEDYYLN